ncbi:hypothetical protein METBISCDRAFT_12442 [Metschnikowia bicuspidata]|uniref:RRM domain-containing protein n=1 Tax=Metschnikowia bicuspidata TaxID=27322 RepID=A0A4P9ZGP4_9ASCO|nr:hypothetical protein METBISCDRAFT_12442 [Metschnikowia bicuspidata]
MELNNLNTPNLDDVARRSSLSSLSSASGYDSSSYNAAARPQGVTPAPQLILSTGLNRVCLSMLNNSSNTNFVSAGTLVATDVGPWVEQQQQQQSLNVGSLDNGKKAADAVPTIYIAPKLSSSTANDSLVDDDEDEELIPTAIVIKNIPFAIKKEQLLDVMTKLGLPQPYAFNYHFDNGVFRGLAFANFASTDETAAVVTRLNGREIGGRKLRVEYKKMLPAQERERIERSKREKRGQLEEQHRSVSNASLASLMSATSTTAATKNWSVNGQNYVSQTEWLFAQYPSVANKLPLPPSELDFNDPEVLELYSQLLTYRDDDSKLIFELAFPNTLNIQHRKTLSVMCQFLNLLELFDNGLIIIRRNSGQQSIQEKQHQSASHTHAHAPQMQPVALGAVVSLHLSSMMNLNQIPTLLGTYGGTANMSVLHAPELLRSQSQSALQLPRSRQQTSTPMQALYSQYQTSVQQAKQVSGSGRYTSLSGFGQTPSQLSVSGQTQLGTPKSSSAAALLRSSNNRSFVDVRNTSGLTSSFQSASTAGSPTLATTTLFPQQLGYFVDSPVSQVSKVQHPTSNEKVLSQFCQPASSSMGSLQPSTALNEEFSLGEPLARKLSTINLGSVYELQNPGGGIWGYKR